MALVSPGVEVTVIDESNYLPAAANSVPFIMIATAQNKVSGSGVGVAAGTLAANANKLYLITSQRDLSATFGEPFFYKTSAGTPINGYELNEYGLLAAFSVLGISNRAYVQRADVDLSELQASLVRPTGDPTDGTWWVDTGESVWGIFEWGYTTGAFTNKVPTVITSTSDLTSGVPKDSIGNIGDYAIVATNINNPGYFKSPGLTVTDTGGDTDLVDANTWVLVGSDDWKLSWPSVIGSNTNPTLTNGQTIYLNDTLVTLSGTTVAALAININDAGIAGVYAAAVNGKLEIYLDSSATNDFSTNDGNGIVDITNGTGTLLTALGITPGIYYAPLLQQSPNYTVPRWRSTDTQPHPSGSVWVKTNNVNQGINLVVKRWDTAIAGWVTETCPVYQNDQSANKALDPAGGGRNIPTNRTYAQYDVNDDDTSTLKVFQRLATGSTIVTGDDTSPTFVNGETFTISWSVKNSDTLTTPATATLAGTGAIDFVTALLAQIPSGAPVTASVTSDGAVQIQHTQGGVIVLEDTSGTPVADAGINTTVTGVHLTNPDDPTGSLTLSNWVALGQDEGYTASSTAPSLDPANGRKWYYSVVDEVDIMIQNGTTWAGYRTVSNDVRGFNLVNTDPNGPQVSVTAPTEQSDGTPLVYGDLWINTTDVEAYPVIYRWEAVDGVAQWVLIDNADQTTENGIIFADARWATNGDTNPITDPIPTIKSLLTSSYLDLDAPSPDLFPTGTLLFNTRRSGYNVKQFAVDYFNAADFPDESLPTETNAWVSVSGYRDSVYGEPNMGRRAVRAIVVQALKVGIDTNQELREEARQYNLIATPGYPELMANMVALNNERNNTGFVVGDTPMRLPDNANAITDWATNSMGQGTDTEDGLVTTDPYMAVFYPACQTSDLTGTTVVQPASHMALRTIIRSDEISYPWLAPAGTRRGVVDNAFALGYINAQTSAFVQTAVRQGIRDTLYENNINPFTFIPGTGITNYGNKTTLSTSSALDRINVARLVAYLRGRLETIGKSYVFEPNDQITRDEIKGTIESLLNDLVAKRGVYDYLVVCDTSNNTPARIDRNELYVDIAIEPVKAVEFIYIPVRIKNTGEIASGLVTTASQV